MTVKDCVLVNLQKIGDRRGNLSIIEEQKQIPFDIKRVYYIYDVPGGERRGGHAYKDNQEFVVALSGSFDVKLSDGEEEKIVSLNRSYYGLYIPAGLWREMENFSTNSLALILSSTEFDDNDYIMNFDEYKFWRNENSI